VVAFSPQHSFEYGDEGGWGSRRFGSTSLAADSYCSDFNSYLEAVPLLMSMDRDCGLLGRGYLERELDRHVPLWLSQSTGRVA
jgi:hypothetical protein